MNDTPSNAAINHAFVNKDRRLALARLGLAAAAVYAAPVLMKLGQANASGGGFFGRWGKGGERGGGSGGKRGGERGGGSGGPVNTNIEPVTAKACGECHEPYSAQNLPDGSWRKMMANLSNHFGEDASMDDTTRRQVESYLINNAGGRGDGPLKITETYWFRRKHDGEVGSRMLSKVKTLGNCKACHGGGRM